MTTLAILLSLCVVLVISERHPHQHHRKDHSHLHRKEPKHQQSHWNVDKDDKYHYFYENFGEKDEGKTYHQSLAGHKSHHNELRNYCKPSDSCWPTTDQLKELNEALNPGIHRTLLWDHTSRTVPAGIPEGADQPLYGEGRELSPLSAFDGTACTDGDDSHFCRLTVRNNPLEGWTPAFVAWPTTTPQVQLLVKFAQIHNLCISITNTGHDYLNRHSCPNSLNIRTTLLKSIHWDTSPYTVQIAAGTTASELLSQAQKMGKMVVVPQGKSVGMVGWSVGGGRSLVGPRFGLGVDQIVGVEVVGADGCVYEVGARGMVKKGLDGKVEDFEGEELLWAVRGGGGSSWGVITSLSLKTHYPVENGAVTSFLWSGFGDCKGDFGGLLEVFFGWSLSLDSRWSGGATIQPYPGRNGCNDWAFEIEYIYQGSDNFIDTWREFTGKVPDGLNPYENIEEHLNLWDLFLSRDIENIHPESNYLQPQGSFKGSQPSVLLSRETIKNGAVVKLLKEQLQKCNADQCDSWELTQDLTGNINSPQDEDVSISPGMRSAIFQMVIPNTRQVEIYYDLGEFSYFSESAYEMEDWPERYWGWGNYRRLVGIKRDFDGGNVFWCRHCVGDLWKHNSTRYGRHP